ncbi:DUF3967 domain-containing protein [Bacillus sp. CGMCC 1.60114]|uniref:DUF3967 domain-containing protein n=1 Tax=unclassified Bacillus (in: firmicutes) TaxID=185979 RepID=UPI00363C1DE3
MTNTPDISYTVSQAADILHMKLPTFKKYYNLIERNSDYKFRRSEQGLVMFEKEDIEMLFRLKELRKQPKVTLEMACEILVDEYELRENGGLSTFSNGPSYQSNVEIMHLIQEQGKTLQQQGLLLAELTKQLQETQKQTPLLVEEAVKNKQKEMETSRDEQLMTVLREIQLVKKEIAASKMNRGIWNNMKRLLGLGRK